MDTVRKSLIEKISQKGVVTPYEAIYLQYLDKQHQFAQVPDIGAYPNPYLAVENVKPIIEPYQLKRLVTFQNQQDCHLYDAYRWVAESMMHFDLTTWETGYKGLALLNELRYMRDENVLKVLINSEASEPPLTKALFEFSAYSHSHQKHLTFQEVFCAFVSEFKYLLISADNILTLNYYLQEMVPPEDFNFTKLLKMWLAQYKNDETAPDDGYREIEGLSFNVTRLCYEKGHDIIISRNHQHFIEFVSEKISDFDIKLSESFALNSLEYVKNVLAKIVS